MGEATPPQARYRNKHISLQEIVEANGRGVRGLGECGPALRNKHSFTRFFLPKVVISIAPKARTIRIFVSRATLSAAKISTK